jgi:hypothetical protein
MIACLEQVTLWLLSQRRPTSVDYQQEREQAFSSKAVPM